VTIQRYGVTEDMIVSYGDLVFRLSNNIQLRRGDPVRLKQFDIIERERANLGMSDAEIGAKIGLSLEQARTIRIIVEHRRFRTDHYQRILGLGAGRRYREERYMSPEQRFATSPDAEHLREAVRFAPAHIEQLLKQDIWNGDTVPRWLSRFAHETPDKPAIVAPAGTLGYGEAFRRSERLARAFTALGLRKGDVIAIQLPNVPEFMIAYFAASMMGAVLAPMHMPYRAREMAPLLRHARARLAICGPALADYVPAETFLALREPVDSLSHVVTVGPPHPGTLSLAQLIEVGPFEDIRNPGVAADPAILCFTSGTSAAPKAVVHNSYTMLANNRLCGPLYELGGDDVLLSGAPFTHAFGICIINFALSVGATQLLLPAFRPDLFVQSIAEHHPTMLFTAPAHIAACLKAGLLDRADLSSLRLATISGSLCPPQLARTLQERMPTGKVMQMWGMTELFMGLNTRLDDAERVRCETIGRPTPGMELRIVDDRGQPVADGEPGELQIRGPSVFAGYYDNSEANDGTHLDGWFRTGDLACRDVEGNFRITGRLKDLINRGGVKINPADVEAIIDKHPKVLQSAIVPMPDEVMGEKACAFIVPRVGDSVILDEICEWLRQNDVAKMKWPERVELIDEMPVTPTRKIIKGLLRPRLG
jgi:cyclohexanecarboxylate-CoA ligase/acyl-CoA synthetase